MLNQTEYLAIAKRVIKQYGPPNLLRDDEAIGEVASYIIRADLKYKPEKGMKPENWRILHGKFGVLVFLKKKSRERKKQCAHLDDSHASTADMMNSILSNEVFEILRDDETITERERAIFNDRHLNNMSLRQLSGQYHLTHQRIHQILASTYNKIRKHYESRS